MTHPPLRVNLLGFGTVGRALANLLLQRGHAEGRGPLRVVAVTDRSGTLTDPAGVDLRGALADKARGEPIAAGRPHGTLAEVVRAVDADVVVDVLPTGLASGEPSRSIARAALGTGRHIVTAGKDLLALHGREARDLARATGCRLLASGAVLGGTPALELIDGAFRGDRITGFQGVLNGSTNFILSRLEEGASWVDALREAQDAGVLEADPALDVQGLDAAAKAVILANHAWGADWTLRDARIRGIDTVDPAEAQAARARGLAVRLVATACPREGVRVAPATLPRDHPLVGSGPENALRLELEAAGAITLRGPGAGGRETAAAVLSDLHALARDFEMSAAPAVAPSIGRPAERRPIEQ